MTLGVLQLDDLLERPMKVISDVGYLLIELIEGVARYSPPKRPISTSNSALHSGQVTGKALEPSSLMRR